MELERQALIYALERIIELEREQHQMQINVLAIFKVFRATSQSEKDPLMGPIRAAKSEIRAIRARCDNTPIN